MVATRFIFLRSKAGWDGEEGIGKRAVRDILLYSWKGKERGVIIVGRMRLLVDRLPYPLWEFTGAGYKAQVLLYLQRFCA